jgi:hypothetical protein
LSFLAWRQFLDTRYVMLPALLLLAVAARALQQLLFLARERSAVSRGARLAPWIMVALLGADLALGLDRGKPHLLECARWMREHIDPRGPRVFTNDKQLAVASGVAWDWDEVHFAGLRLGAHNAPLDGVQYWVIRERAGRAPLVADLVYYAPWLQQVIAFEGQRGDRVVVYRIQPAP